MKNIPCIVILILAVCSMTSYAEQQPSTTWQLVYENDAKGNKIYGIKQDLINAIEKGQDVKVVWHMGAGKSKVTHAAQVMFLTVMDENVFGQINTIMSQKPDVEAAKVGFRGELKWTMIVSTTGSNANMYFNNKNSEKAFYEANNAWGTKWFVKP